MIIGKDLRRARIAKGMTLDDLSKKSGYSKALISRVETGSVSPSLESLEKIASLLGLTLHDIFISVERDRSSLVCKGERRRFNADGGTSIEFLTSNVATKMLEPVKITLSPGHQSGGEPRLHHSEQFILVLTGKIEVTIGKKTTKLSAGDSLHFAAGIPHSWRNIGKDTAEFVSVTTPPQI
jgi:quercetin dioxygenase-like cupin family protein/DNA-binding XRE family transcriptional regulator